MATQNQIKSIIKKQLASFNPNKVEITDDTLLSDVFITTSAIAKRNPDLFKGIVLWTLNSNNHKREDGKKNAFPSGWLNMTAAGLAEKLFLLLLCSLSFFVSMAQVQLNVGTVKTDLRQNAVNFAFTYLKSLDSTFGNQDYMLTKKSSYLLVTPEAEFKVGTEDAFSSIILKLTGNYVKFRTTTVDGLITPDADKTLHVFPISFGAETNNQFNFVNGLLEVGYEPYYHSPLAKSADWVKHTMFGIYVQAGYKFNIGGKDSLMQGGARDESKEDMQEGILRLKGDLTVDTDEIITIQGVKIGLVGRGTAWYDALNSAIYHRIDGKVRFYLTQQTFFDLQYSNGSGAPNFNQGDQYGVGLTIAF